MFWTKESNGSQVHQGAVAAKVNLARDRETAKATIFMARIVNRSFGCCRLLALSYACLVLQGTVCFARQFFVEGTFTRTVLLPGNRMTNEYSFSAFIQDCRYHVEVYSEGAHEDAWYDGKNFYDAIYPKPVPLEEVKPDDAISINAHVTSQMFPKLGPFWMLQIWFPFGGRCYLASSPQGTVPLELLQAGEGSTEAEIVFHSDDKEIVDFAAIFRPKTLNADRRKAGGSPEPVGRGYTNVIFRNLEFQRAGNVTVPTLFEWTYYMPPSGDGASEIMARATGRVKRVDLLPAQTSLKPRLQGKAAIFDHRMAKATGVPTALYFANEFYEPKTKAFKAAAATIIMSQPTPPVVTLNKRSWKVPILVACLALAFGALFAVRMIMRRAE